MPTRVPKRLTRPSKEKAPAFRLTERDVDLARIVNAYRFASSDQLYRFLAIEMPGTSRQKVGRRLQAMFAHGLLDRPKQQAIQIGTLSPLVYSIGPAGLKLIASSADAIDARALWAAKASRTASALFLDHALGVTEFMLATNEACSTRAGAHLIDQPKLIANFPETTRAQKHPLRLRVTIAEDFRHKRISVIPDRLFAIDYHDGRRFFAHEWDTGSMTIAARKLSTSSFGRKLRAYLTAYEEQRFKSQWACDRLRVLTVTSSPARITAMLHAQREITNDRLSAMFLYTTVKRLIAHGPLSSIWLSAERDGIALLPEE